MANNLIIIDITDVEKTLIDGLMTQKEIGGTGKLIIKNPSQKSRLWNLTCDLKEIVNTSVDAKVLNVGALNFGQEFARDYKIQNLKEPCLKIVEIFDTEREIADKVNNVFLFQRENKCNLKLTCENTLSLPISDIKVRREMPEILQNVEIKAPNSGIAQLIEDDGKPN